LAVEFFDVFLETMQNILMPVILFSAPKEDEIGKSVNVLGFRILSTSMGTCLGLHLVLLFREIRSASETGLVRLPWTLEEVDLWAYSNHLRDVQERTLHGST